MATTEEELVASAEAPAAVPLEGRDVAPPSDAGTDEGARPEPKPSLRLAVAVAFPAIGAAIMVGGVFNGVSPRFYGAIAAALGVALAYGVSHLRGRTFLSNVLVVAGLFAIGLVLIGPANIFSVQSLAASAASQGDLLRPPVDFSPGWRAISSWLMGTVGFSAAWLALVLRRPSIGVLVPLPVAAIAAISVPDSAQKASGIAVLVLFAVSLGILSSEQSAEEGETPSLAFELIKALKSLPVLIFITAVLYLLSSTDFLFPSPVFDPASEPQRPKAQPLTADDRVLFEVESELSGPWRIGSLDVYDGEDWRLPPFAEAELDEIPKSGVVDPDLQARNRAAFTVRGLGGAVLPTLPNTVGVVADGPRLAYDSRNGNIRLVQGQVSAGQRYTVTAAGLPTVSDLEAIGDPIPRDIREFLDIPEPPPAVRDLMQRARVDGGRSRWEQFDYARTFVLENVVASGTGTPVAITPARVQEILAVDLEASPFEIVATQAMLARWIGIPARIGYGFDGGEEIEGRLQVRPLHGAAFVEVYFPGFKWLPVIGTPRQAEPTVGSDPSQQRADPSILPSDDIAVQLFLPTIVPPDSVVAKQILLTSSIAFGILLLLLLTYILWPAIWKAILRSRRRDLALEEGVRTRVALAYSEFRDYATDFGFLYPTDTPLMFLDRFIEDEEHTELAWLTTRVLWGDLQHDDDPLMATVAEELSRALRRRLAAAQPSTARAVAWVSRLSLRDPYAPPPDETASRFLRSRKEHDRDALSV